MIVYLYLAIIIVVSIVTGVIVTIIERKGFYPKVQKQEKPVKEVKKQREYQEEPIITNAVTIMNMKPIHLEDEEEVSSYDEPVLLSSYTVDLSDVVKDIQAQKKKDQTEILDDTFIKTEGLV